MPLILLGSNGMKNTRAPGSRSSAALRGLDFELAYLALLTQEGLKPLSRWERESTPGAEETLRGLGLKTRLVERSTRCGSTQRELVFSPKEELVAQYAARFAGTRLHPSGDGMRLEGLWFGYPSCCVESYARRGYGKNALPHADQRLLFHWACPRCALTPLLLPQYREVYRECHGAVPGRASSLWPRRGEAAGVRGLRRAVAVAAALGFLGTGLAVGDAGPSAPDPHWLGPPPSADQDGDLLSDAEEADLGTDRLNPDQDGNQVLDGVDRARSAATVIGALPTKPAADRVYRLDFPLRGLERCDVCGTNVNMGHLTICNPVAELYVNLPYLAVHFLEHGSFSFAGNVHGTGRNDVPLLLEALRSQGATHRVSVPDDPDGDGLKDAEEKHFGTNPSLKDTDGDGVPDGFGLAHALGQAVSALPRTPAPTPYVVEHPATDLMPCGVCGSNLNAGWFEVVNRKENLAVRVPGLALHFLRHGSFAWSPQDRLQPGLLDQAVHGDGAYHLVVVPGDSDADGLLDGEEARFGTQPDVADSNGDGVLDGVAVARKLGLQVRALPTEPERGRYLIHHPADCIAPCSVCGQMLDCGFVTVTNSWSELSLDLTYRALHFLEQGSLAASVTERVDPVLLEAILSPAVVLSAPARRPTLRWMGRAGHTYQVFTAPEIGGPWTAGPTFDGTGTEVVFEDVATASSARKFYKITVR